MVTLWLQSRFMASTFNLHNFCSISSNKCCSHLISCTPISFSKLKKQSILSPSLPCLQTFNVRTRKQRSRLVVFAVQSNFLKALQQAWKVGNDGIEAATSMVPDSVPRPVARISVTVVALSVALFVLKSFISTAFFVLATMGLVYFIFIALNKDEGPKGGGGGGGSSPPVDDPVEEARRIMEKYK